jgi:hypothetical protein
MTARSSELVTAAGLETVVDISGKGGPRSDL